MSRLGAIVTAMGGWLDWHQDSDRVHVSLPGRISAPAGVSRQGGMEGKLEQGVSRFDSTSLTLTVAIPLKNLAAVCSQ